MESASSVLEDLISRLKPDKDKLSLWLQGALFSTTTPSSHPRLPLHPSSSSSFTLQDVLLWKNKASRV